MAPPSFLCFFQPRTKLLSSCTRHGLGGKFMKKKKYEMPLVEVLEAKVELGFAGSGGGNGGGNNATEPIGNGGDNQIWN